MTEFVLTVPIIVVRLGETGQRPVPLTTMREHSYLGGKLGTTGRHSASGTIPSIRPVP